MKVPIRYKSSDRYNAGVDVVYDDESKMQYAPFVYATTASGDNGGSEDEEGEDSMVVNITTTETGMLLDKTWQEIYDAVDSGKYVLIRKAITSEFYLVYHLDMVRMNTDNDPATYEVDTHAIDVDLGRNTTTNNTRARPISLTFNSVVFTTDTATGTPANLT